MIDPGTLISSDYLKLQQQLHASPRGYGEGGDKWAKTVALVADLYGAGSILDYGCGQGSLVRALRKMGRGWRLAEYDPAIAGKSGPPAFADMVVCTDVLEHIEPDRLDRVLAHIKSLMRKVGFLVISTRPANKVMADGRNAHLIVEPGDWWEARVQAAGFTLQPLPAIERKKPAKEWVGVVTC